MTTKEVNDSIIGKRCKCIFSGLMVIGTIEDVKISKHAAEVKVRYDEPQTWGSQTYNDGWNFARLHDEFGSLRHLEIIDEGYQTLQVTFAKPIRQIDRMFTEDYANWQTVSLKEWIDSYESTRFTPIGTHTAIITSEYNMDHVREWLVKQFAPTEIKIEPMNHGCSVCKKEQENYITFIAGACRGTKYYQYEYKDPVDGKLFSTIDKSLEECRKRRDEWLLNKWWWYLNFEELENITGIEQDRDGNNEMDAKFLDDANKFWEGKSFEEKKAIYQANPDLHDPVKERMECY